MGISLLRQVLQVHETNSRPDQISQTTADTQPEIWRCTSRVSSVPFQGMGIAHQARSSL
jgi:hypothetical protein